MINIGDKFSNVRNDATVVVLGFTKTGRVIYGWDCAEPVARKHPTMLKVFLKDYPNKV